MIPRRIKASESNCLTKDMLFVTRIRALVESNPFGPMTLSNQLSEEIRMDKFYSSRLTEDMTSYMTVNGSKTVIEKNTAFS